MDFITWIVENQENLRDTYQHFKEETGDQDIPLDEFCVYMWEETTRTKSRTIRQQLKQSERLEEGKKKLWSLY